MKKRFLITCLIVVLLIISSVPVFALNVNVNGKTVVFDNNSGYPLIDENNRTLVPLRATMEAAGAGVSWNSTTKTAEVYKNHTTVLVPVGQSYITVGQETIQNDASAVIIDGRVYLPIRAVLQALGFTVEWDSTSKTVFASDYKVVTEWTPFYTDNIEDLAKLILNGDVVYYNGQYWASPEYTTSLSNEEVVYYHDVSQDK